MSRWDGVGDRWAGRAKRVGALVLPGSRVLDLGAGAAGLGRYLDPSCTYYPVDLPAFDMNRGLWPEGRFDVVTMTGVLEYAADPADVFRRLRKLAPVAIITYSHGGKRRDPDWNDLDRDAFIEQATAAGWEHITRAATWRSRGLRRQDIWVLR